MIVVLRDMFMNNTKKIIEITGNSYYEKAAVFTSPIRQKVDLLKSEIQSLSYITILCLCLRLNPISEKNKNIKKRNIRQSLSAF